MEPLEESVPTKLLSLPDAALFNVMRQLDAVSLARLEATSTFFSQRQPVSRLPLTEHLAKEHVLARCGGDLEVAARFKNVSWKQRLYLEESTGCGFDTSWCEDAGFVFDAATEEEAARVRLAGMGPKLLLSDISTADQPVLRWRLRVRGNTAAEFGILPVALTPTHTALHKNLPVPGAARQRCTGFCSQITAGSLLPIKFPVMRGTVLDLVARRGCLQAVLHYPADAKEITWHNGQPVQRPYRGPSQLRFELDFPDDHDIRLAVTAWAKAAFEVLHEPAVLCTPTPSPAGAMACGEAIVAAPIAAATAIDVATADKDIDDAASDDYSDSDQSSIPSDVGSPIQGSPVLGSSSSSSEMMMMLMQQQQQSNSGDGASLPRGVTRSDSRCTISLDGTEEEKRRDTTS